MARGDGGLLAVLEIVSGRRARYGGPQKVKPLPVKQAMTKLGTAEVCDKSVILPSPPSNLMGVYYLRHLKRKNQIKRKKEYKNENRI